MKIDFIKHVIEVAKECGCLVTITLVNGQVSHVDFSKHIKKFTTTDDVIYNEEEHIVTIIDTDGNCDYIDSDSIIRIFLVKKVFNN